MSSTLPEPQTIQLSKLPYAFRKRLTTLAPTQIVNELSKLCKSDKIETYDHVFITDNDKVFRWASEDTFLFRIFKFLHQFAVLRFFLDGWFHTNPMWEDVLHVKETGREHEHVYVKQTLVLYCDSPDSYSKVLPFICGPYTRLILHGNIRCDQVLRLIHSGVKRVRIDASIQMQTQQYDYFADFVASKFKGFNSSFVLFITPTVTDQLKTKLRDASQHRNRRCEEMGISKQRVAIEHACNAFCYAFTLFSLAVCGAFVTTYIIYLREVALYGESCFASTFLFVFPPISISSFVMIMYLGCCPPRTDQIDVSKL